VRDEYEIDVITRAYDAAHTGTDGFTRVTVEDLTDLLRIEPATLRIFRLILGFSPKELATATQIVAADLGLKEIGEGRIKSMEEGRKDVTGLAAARAAASRQQSWPAGTLVARPLRRRRSCDKGGCVATPADPCRGGVALPGSGGAPRLPWVVIVVGGPPS
jgi:hypothetical protein